MNRFSSAQWDVIIIGSGFAGAALAYFTARQGARVLVLEAGEICSGSSGACAGRVQLIDSHPDEYLDIVLSGYERLQSLGEELGTDLEWCAPGNLTLVPDMDSWQVEQERVAHLVKRGIEAEMLDRDTLKAAEPYLASNQFLGASRSPEGHINPFKFCFGFANSAQRLNVIFQSHTPVTGFEQRHNQITAVITPNERFSAATVVVACGAWSGSVLALAGIQFPIQFTHAEAMITELLPPILNHHISLAGFYKAVHGGEQSVALGVGQHPNGTLLVSNAIQQAKTINMDSTHWSLPALSKAFQDVFPRLSKIRVVRTWAAPSPFMPDQRPALGWISNFDNLYIAAGFHLAIPTIPILCEQAANEIVHRSKNHLWAQFRPDRFSNQIKIP